MKHMTRRSFLSLIAVAAYAQIDQPKCGYIVDRKGNLRILQGVPGAFTLGKVVQQAVVSAAYSGKSLIVKKEDELVVDGQRFDAPAGPIEVAFDPNGRPMEIFFPNTGKLWTWKGTRFEETYAPGLYNAPEIRDGNLLVNGIPVTLPSPAERVSRMAEEWLVVYAKDRIFAVGSKVVMELPEDAE